MSALGRLKDAFKTAEHVCFDKDGTLTDVHAYWAHTCRLRAARLAMRHPRASSEALLAGMGIDPAKDRILPGGPVGLKPRPDVIRAAVDALAAAGAVVPPAEVEAVFKELDLWQQEHASYKVVELAGARELLDALARHGKKLSIFSSDRRENSARVFESLGWTARFAAVVGGGCIKKSKPSPEGFLEACKRVGAAPGKSIYVGDTVEDMLMAAEGGALAAVGVATGLATAEELEAHTPFVVAGLAELSEVLGA
ncbi:MAG: HAD family hydrolase [Elusimicrobia bacterium]|nr:HAD family hydrolase [Elusimicrobiota bacterium]